MTDEELIKRLREIGMFSFEWTADQAADRIEALVEQLDRMAYRWAKEGVEKQVALGRADALELALTQSRAETAAAYERAADACADYPSVAPYYDEWTRYDEQIEHSQKCIRSLATPEQTAALDAVKAEARAQGMREAAEIADELAEEVSRGHDNGERASIRILAAIQKGEPKWPTKTN